ncbi:MAG: HAMP domain-containing histidine kinase [Burkholderiales bacterium]|nr:HAMP domain-containing histidine kinase [Burkholderiales bacterium]
MRSGGSLRRRIVAAYVLLACAVCTFFAVAAYAAMMTIESRLIDRRLERAAAQVLDRYWRGLPLGVPVNVALYRDHDIPPRLRGLGPGMHEVTEGGPPMQVLVRVDRGLRFVFTDDDTDFENIRLTVYQVLGAAFAACLVLAVVLGRATASRVIAPVTALARAVEQDDGKRVVYPFVQSGDEIGVLARAFSARTEELNRFLARERWFVGDVSHELRTPLTIMLGAAEVLCARLHESADLHATAERIRRTAADTAERVSALLLLSRAPETVDAPRIALTPLIRHEMERCQPLLHRKAVTMTLGAPTEVHVFSRPELAAMALGNLIRNACQFTEEGHVLVALEPGRVVVEDTGVGVPDTIRERLFERFVRASADESTGSGLGLAIVRRVADHLGWDIRFEVRQGGGSRFILSWDHPS